MCLKSSRSTPIREPFTSIILWSQSRARAYHRIHRFCNRLPHHHRRWNWAVQTYWNRCQRWAKVRALLWASVKIYGDHRHRNIVQVNWITCQRKWEFQRRKIHSKCLRWWPKHMPKDTKFQHMSWRNWSPRWWTMRAATAANSFQTICSPTVIYTTRMITVHPIRIHPNRPTWFILRHSMAISIMVAAINIMASAINTKPRNHLTSHRK